MTHKTLSEIAECQANGTRLQNLYSSFGIINIKISKNHFMAKKNSNHKFAKKLDTFYYGTYPAF